MHCSVDSGSWVQTLVLTQAIYTKPSPQLSTQTLVGYMRRVSYHVHCIGRRIGVKVGAKAVKDAKRRALLWGNT